MELSLLDSVLESGPGIVRVTFDFSRQRSCMATIQAWSNQMRYVFVKALACLRKSDDDPESSRQGDEGLNPPPPFSFPCPASCSYSTPFLSLSTAPCIPQYLSDQ